jgi:hypothetical protein
MSCPFFGRIGLPVSRVLQQRRGSVHCALSGIGLNPLPCKMHGANREPDWAKCDENTGAIWKNEMLKWAENAQGQKKLMEFRYPD